MPSKKPVNKDADTAVREHILNLLRGRGAHLNFDDVIKSLPESSRGKKVKAVPYTMWQLLEHMRLAQWDILEFSRDANHISPKFPEGYWPKADAPPDDAAWNSSVKSFKKDLEAMQKLVEDSTVDLYAPIPHGEGQTILREALLIADHNAYHLGQLVLLRRLTEVDYKN
jgi:DinB superfamily